MATVQITEDLQQFVQRLSSLKDATSVTDPEILRPLKKL